MRDRGWKWLGTSLVVAWGAAACGGGTSSTPNNAAGQSGSQAANGSGATHSDLAGGSQGGAAGTTDGGSGASAGHTPTLGGAAASSPAFEACVTYSIKACQRYTECGYGYDCSPENVSINCPDRYFSPGSVRTPEGLAACADRWATQPCDKIALGVPPDCALPGTRPEGAPCLFPAQCEGSECTGPAPAGHPRCSTCAHILGADEDCTTVVGECPFPQRCDAASKRCAPVTALPQPRQPPAKAGEACRDSCEGDLKCLGTSPSPTAATCRALPGAGEGCGYGLGDEGGLCAPGTSCSASGTCQVLPPADADCLIDAQSVGHCTDGTFCANGMRCEPMPAVGERCGNNQDGHALACPAGSFCRDPGGPGTCTAMPVAGEACVSVYLHLESLSEDTSGSSFGCATGFVCDCARGECSGGTCKRPLQPGQVCGQSDSLCVSGSACVDGTCQRGHLFEQLCEG
jgi:hypothetical protein